MREARRAESRRTHNDHGNVLIKIELTWLGMKLKVNGRGGSQSALALSILIFVRAATAIAGGCLAFLIGAPWWATILAATVIFIAVSFTGSVRTIRVTSQIPPPRRAPGPQPKKRPTKKRKRPNRRP
jgi:hypothetical protein